MPKIVQTPMKTVIVTIIAVVALLAMAIALIGVKQIFLRGERFSPGHAHDLPRLRRRARERLEEHRKNKHNTKNN